MDSFIRFERRHEKLVPLPIFLRRLGRNVALAVGLIVPSLVLGMAGFMAIEGKGLAEAYDNAAMILSGMGPFDMATTAAGQIFEGTYALYSGLLVVGVSGLILAPVFHRVLHNFHVPDDDDPEAKVGKDMSP